MGVRPLPGMVPIAEYASRWEADVAAARLREAGYEAAVLVDPATEIAPHHITHRLAVLVVRAEVADPAAEVLGLERPDIEADRPFDPQTTKSAAVTHHSTSVGNDQRRQRWAEADEGEQTKVNRRESAATRRTR